MKNFNVTKLDSKGRLLVPFHIRELLNLDENSEFLIINNGNRELKVLPLLDGQTAELSMMIEDVPGSLSKAADLLAKKKIDIIMSQSKTLEKGKLAEWHAIIDISQCKDTKKVVEELKTSKFIKSVELRGK
jgi:bifunctional DNA-binding transcriptional regulator/antitoxin component of YhaV-PrlF toxin-antitoxin module